MSQKRSLTGFLVASLGLAAGLAVFSGPVSAADDCSKIKTDSVKAVCEKGGVKAVKSSMKTAVDDANKAGVKPEKGAKFECKTCHTNSSTFETNGEATAEFKKIATYFK